MKVEREGRMKGVWGKEGWERKGKERWKGG